MFEWSWQVCIKLTVLCLAPSLSPLSLFFTLNINEGKHCVPAWPTSQIV